MLVALGTIAAVQNQGIQNTADAVEHLLDYCASHQDAIIRYRPSNMILRVHSNTSYSLFHAKLSRFGLFPP
eukprot:576143-Ditylum_brightwellii.AAC.1